MAPVWRHCVYLRLGNAQNCILEGRGLLGLLYSGPSNSSTLRATLFEKHYFQEASLFCSNVRAAVARRHWALLEELYSAPAQLFQELCCANKTRVQLLLEKRYMIQGRRPPPCNDMETWGGTGGGRLPTETVAFICNQICCVK